MYRFRRLKVRSQVVPSVQLLVRTLSGITVCKIASWQKRVWEKEIPWPNRKPEGLGVRYAIFFFLLIILSHGWYSQVQQGHTRNNLSSPSPRHPCSSSASSYLYVTHHRRAKLQPMDAGWDGENDHMLPLITEMAEWSQLGWGGGGRWAATHMWESVCI